MVPYRINATCNTSINPSDPNAQAALQSCLNAQRIYDQQIRDQQAANAAYDQAIYQSQLTYFYKLDAIEKQIDIKYASDSGYDLYRLGSGDCTMSIDIPSDPTTINPNIFLSRMTNKKNCVDYLTKYMGNHPINTQTQTPSGTLCNGKYWRTCPVGTTFYCPSIGDAQCTQPTKTNDQICSDKFGPNVKWDGTKNSSGGLSCDCKIGYQWDASQTGCIVTPPTPITPVKIINQDVIPSEITQQPVNNPTPVKNDTPEIIKQKIETESPAPVIENEQKADDVLKTLSAQTNPEPVHKLKWYQKIWNWFMRR